MEAIKNNDTIALDNISKHMDPNINKLFKFCLRIINKENMYVKDVMAKTAILHGLERIGDFYTEISRMLLKNKSKLSQDTLKLYGDTNRLLERFYEQHYKLDKDKLEKLHIDAKKSREELISKMSKPGMDSSVLSTLKEINNQLREIMDWILPLEIKS